MQKMIAKLEEYSTTLADEGWTEPLEEIRALRQEYDAMISETEADLMNMRPEGIPWRDLQPKMMTDQVDIADTCDRLTVQEMLLEVPLATGPLRLVNLRMGWTSSGMPGKVKQVDFITNLEGLGELIKLFRNSHRRAVEMGVQ